MAFVARPQQLLQCESARAPAKRTKTLDRLIDFFAAALGLGYQARYRPAVPSDDNGVATLDFVKNPEQMGLRLGGLHFSNHRYILTGRFDQSS
jgi:hypothetical protein